ncbi:MAG: gluconate transporter [Frankiales bacterium]|nr:gluconate transporter [Frankiales bacterium]
MTGNTQLGLAAALGIATVVLLITWGKVHPFLSLILGSAVLGSVAGLAPEKTISSFTAGVGATVGSVGLLIALGAMIGGLLADSGGAQGLVGAVVARFTGRNLPWAMAGVASLVGIPLFFEVGVVLLVPIVLLVAARGDLPLLRIGIPALAGLSVLHGLVPPHPGPLVAIAALKADLVLTLLFGLLVAVPTVILAGPVYGGFISRYVDARPPRALLPDRALLTTAGAGEHERAPDGRPPSVGAAVATVLLPVALMLARAVGELTLDEGDRTRTVLDVVGTPVVALLAGVLVAMATLGAWVGRSREQVSASLSASLPPIAGILLIVAAGGGFKQTLIDAGVGKLVADAATGASLSPLLLGWLVAVGIRLATGSATVATITAAGIVAPLSAGLDRPTVALLALALGAGSLFFSHVNDAGFWLVKEYFGMTVRETILSWSVMETIISVVGLLGVLLLNAFV